MNEPICRIPLSQQKYAVVDACDYKWLMGWKWHAFRNGKTNVWYAKRTINHPDRNPEGILMHREIALRAGLPYSPRYDHKDRDGLNNRRGNLRPCTVGQNCANKGKKRTKATSRYKGVSWCTTNRVWHAQIMVNYKTINLGYFDDEEEAAEAYRVGARKHFGEFACFTEPTSPPPLPTPPSLAASSPPPPSVCPC